MTEVTDVVVGAGIWGCTLARRLAEAGRRVLVLERREAIGGNVRCETDPETGIEVHVYGSHIFHTHDIGVWNYVRRFTDFNGYQHKVLASYRGRLYQLPLGLGLINKFFGLELQPKDVAAFMADEHHSTAVFDAFFRGYTSKQWGRAPEEIDPGIIKRVPVRSDYDTNYFNDCLQGIPSDGYNRLFERLIEHPSISLECGVEVSIEKVRAWAEKGVRVFYSGPIDRLFGYCHGALPWRSLRFESETLPMRDFQGTSVVNYTEAEVPYTRVHEFKHYHPEGRLTGAWGFTGDRTVIMREYPQTWKLGDEPYYPVVDAASTALLGCYRAEVDAFNATVPKNGARLVVGGRLGSFRYLDMDQAMAAALAVEIG